MDMAVESTGSGLKDQQIQFKSLLPDSQGEDTRAPAVGDSTVELSNEQHQKLLDYLTARLSNGHSKRLSRISRYARVDQSVVTWMKLSPEDSLRDLKEDNTGRQQALPMTIPLSQNHIDETVAFFAEIFAPIGGNFYQLPGKKEKTDAVGKLAEEMNQDAQLNNYYSNVCMTMRQLVKYNVGGFDIYWSEGDQTGVGSETVPGNVCESIDMYNVDWDNSVEDVDKIAKDAEWTARFRVRNRLWILRQAEAGRIINLDKVLNPPISSNDTWSSGKAKYYRNPPAQTKMSQDGADTKTTASDQSGGMDWASWGLGLEDDAYVEINGHEIAKIYCWINPNQFNLAEDEEDKLELWHFLLCDGRVIIQAQRVPDAKTIPQFFGRVNKDNMHEVMRSIVEYIRPFQRFISFLINTHVEATRGAIWGLKIYDPTAIDPTVLKKGETSGLIPLLAGATGRDVRAVFADIRNNLDTKSNIDDAAGFIELVKQFFPNQNLPAQISGMDRAVTSQVSAVLQGAMRKMHMLARLIDSDIMLPSRQQQYRNIATLSPNKGNFTGITEDEVASLLASGLGQINREAAAEQIRQLIFALLQNPDTMQTIDLAQMFNFWSNLMNIGTNLGDFVRAQPTGPIDTQVPNPDGSNGAPAATQPTAV